MTDSITILEAAEASASAWLSIIYRLVSTTGQNSRLAGLYKLLLRSDEWRPTKLDSYNESNTKLEAAEA